jgi:polar amino acid transport system substrate-binding protein
VELVRSQRTPLAAVVVVLLPLLFGCINLAKPESKPERVPSPGLAYIARTGEIRIGTSGEQPPLSMTTKSGDLIGLDIAIARVLARAMGVEPRFVQLPFGQLIGAIEKGEVELVMSGMTINPERSLRVAFVGPYYTSGKAILTKSKQLAAAKIPEDLDSPELRFAALAGSTSESFVTGRLPQAKLVATERLEAAVQMVVDGEVDALVADRETCHFAVLRHPDAGLITSEASFTVEPMGIALSPDDPRLANLVQTYLDALAQSGALEKARAFWFRDESWVGSIK